MPLWNSGGGGSQVTTMEVEEGERPAMLRGAASGAGRDRRYSKRLVVLALVQILSDSHHSPCSSYRLFPKRMHPSLF